MSTISALHHPAGTGTLVGPGLELRLAAAVTDGAFSVHEGVIAPGDEIGSHVHDSTDHVMYVIDGELEMTVGDDSFVARAGDLVAQPHGVVHGFANRSDAPVRCLEISTGDAFERFTLAAAEVTDPAEFPRLQVAHGIHPVDS